MSSFIHIITTMKQRFICLITYLFLFGDIFFHLSQDRGGLQKTIPPFLITCEYFNLWKKLIEGKSKQMQIKLFLETCVRSRKEGIHLNYKS